MGFIIQLFNDFEVYIENVNLLNLSKIFFNVYQLIIQYLVCHINCVVCTVHYSTRIVSKM